MSHTDICICTKRYTSDLDILLHVNFLSPQKGTINKSQTLGTDRCAGEFKGNSTEVCYFEMQEKNEVDSDDGEVGEKANAVRSDQLSSPSGEDVGVYLLVLNFFM